MNRVNFSLDQFSGPLDLLLALLDEKKLSIGEISLSSITEQYLSYVEKIPDKNADELADFLVVATRLLLLKSRSLLPQFAPEDVDEVGLENQLRLYKAFVEASRKINKLWLAGRRAVWRVEPPRKSEGVVWPTNTNLETLHRSMVQLVNRLKPLKPLPQATIDRTVSLKEKIEQIKSLLKRVERANFFEVVESSQNKTEVIMSFLAILELMKQKTVALEQSQTFGDIEIFRLT